MSCQTGFFFYFCDKLPMSSVLLGEGQGHRSLTGFSSQSGFPAPLLRPLPTSSHCLGVRTPKNPLTMKYSIWNIGLTTTTGVLRGCPPKCRERSVVGRGEEVRKLLQTVVVPPPHKRTLHKCQFIPYKRSLSC